MPPESPGQSQSQALRVCAWPDSLQNNATHDMLYSELRRLGVSVTPYDQMRVLRGAYDVLHVHWPDAWINFRSAARALARLLVQIRNFRKLKAKGTKIVWTVHNLRTHECRHPRLDAMLWRRFLPLVDGFISLTRSAVPLILERFPELADRKRFVIPHGHYRDAYPNTIRMPEARTMLGLEASSRVVCHVGILRPYKNVPALIRRFRELPDVALALVVAGLPQSKAIESEIRGAAAGDPRVRLELRRLADDELQVFLNACDLLALPFTEILNSGTALLGLSFDRPVLVPDKGSMAELRELAGEGYVRTYSGALSAETLAGALEWARNSERPARAPLDDLGWASIAKMTLDAYRDVLGHAQSGQDPASNPSSPWADLRTQSGLKARNI